MTPEMQKRAQAEAQHHAANWTKPPLSEAEQDALAHAFEKGFASGYRARSEELNTKNVLVPVNTSSCAEHEALRAQDRAEVGGLKSEARLHTTIVEQLQRAQKTP